MKVWGRTKILVYWDLLKEDISILIDMLDEHLPKGGFEIIPTLERLERAVRKPGHSPLVILGVISSKDELRKLAQMGPLLEDERILLLLPDGDQETLSLAHKCGPRFVTWGPRAIFEIQEILKRIIEEANRQQGASDGSASTNPEARAL
ncbi:MAG: hypothetical protein QXH08_04735 [Candidatus Hadarchaeales archaeon]